MTEETLEKRMTFGEHLDDLRWCLIKAIIGIVLCVTVAMFFQRPLMWVVRAPHRYAFPATAQQDSRLVAFSYQVPFIVHFKVALIFGLLASSPWVVFQLWSFVSAGLFPRERRHATRYGFISFALFLAGVAFGYFLLIPYALWFLAGLSKFYEVSLVPDIDAYVSLVLTMTILVGVVFQLPLVMLFTVRLGLATAKTFSSKRRYAILLAFIVGGLLTPPDPITQPMLAIPLILLFELGILLAKVSGPAASKAVRTQSDR
ncbi:MAG: twin-arginine translocase subunit TatC [Planctomycetota bacterium]|nr:twin-arginine translocase subunit TatC [Planctomycetota bacterium]